MITLSVLFYIGVFAWWGNIIILFRNQKECSFQKFVEKHGDKTFVNGLTSIFSILLFTIYTGYLFIKYLP